MVSGDQPEPAQEPKSESRATPNRESNNKGVRRAAGGSGWDPEKGAVVFFEREIQSLRVECVSACLYVGMCFIFQVTSRVGETSA
jgi:hypothetical protein